jgi:hypothetical protein
MACGASAKQYLQAAANEKRPEALLLDLKREISVDSFQGLRLHM